MDLKEIADDHNKLADKYIKALELLRDAESVLRGNGQYTLAEEIEDFLIYES